MLPLTLSSATTSFIVFDPKSYTQRHALCQPRRMHGRKVFSPTTVQFDKVSTRILGSTLVLKVICKNLTITVCFLSRSGVGRWLPRVDGRAAAPAKFHTPIRINNSPTSNCKRQSPRSAYYVKSHKGAVRHFCHWLCAKRGRRTQKDVDKSTMSHSSCDRSCARW